MKTIYTTLALGLLAGTANAQTTYVADFSTVSVGFLHGAVLHGDEYNSLIGSGFNFDAKGQNGNGAIIFDTRRSHTADPDLELPIVGGNLKGAQLDDILIFADNLHGAEKDGIVDDPNDSASGGDLHFSFNADDVSDFGFALIDASQDKESFAISFTDSNSKTVNLSLEQYLAISGTKNFVTGDNHANQFAQTSAAQLGLSNIQGVTIKLRGSGGFDNFTWTEGVSVPEPSSALLAFVGLGLVIRRRR